MNPFRARFVLFALLGITLAAITSLAQVYTFHYPGSPPNGGPGPVPGTYMPPPPHLSHAGTCETVAFTAGGVFRPAGKYVLWNNFFMQQEFSNGLGSPFRYYLDPSGIKFLLFTPALPNERLWLEWDGSVMTRHSWGETRKTGNCNIASGFRTAIETKTPAQPQFDQAAIELRGNGSNTLLPGGILPSGTHIVPPMMPTLPVVTECRRKAPNSDNGFLDCVAEKSMGAKQLEMYKCMREAGGDSNKVSLCILDKQLGAEERKALSQFQTCYAENGQDWDEYPECMAKQRVDPRAIRAIACAREQMSNGQSPSYWQMAACYFGPEIFAKLNLNAETVVAIECATQSGGDPMTFVGCTGGRLTQMELQKCLDDGVGGEGGCFGEGNSLSQAYEKIGNEIANTFGKDSPLHLLWQGATVSNNPAQAIKVLDDVSREVGKAGPATVDAITKGVNNITREASKLVPKIKVKTPW
jgi:hypothetical protein